jgi:hypothetical protein
MSRKTGSMRMRDKIVTILQTESAPPPNEPNSAADAEQGGFQRFMQEYAKRQGTAIGTIWNECAGPHNQAAARRGKWRL